MIRDTTNRQINILIIDDDIDVCHYLDGFLSNNNFKVKFTTDPEKSIPLIREEMFQIIILDIVMPKINGMELLKQIRQIDSDICVIILSGYPTFEYAREAFKSDCYEFISKPFENSRLLEVINKAINKWGMISDLNQIATNNIASIVKRLRNDQSLSLRQLANRTGLSPSLIYQIEHSQTTPSLATLSKLATALNTTLEHFFKGL
jgi:DNA-binding NtrC family response regulator